MKNVKKYALASLLLVPALMFAGCNDSKSYSVITRSSSEILGTAIGGSQSAIKEGSKVSLSAFATAENSEFLCWVQNSSKIISTEAQTEIKVSEATSGVYTAVFSEPSPDTMTYAMASNIYIDAEGIASASFTTMYSSHENIASYRTLSSGTFNNSSSNNIKGADVFYFGNGETQNKFSFKVVIENVTYVSNNIVANFGEIVFDEVVDNSAFDANGQMVLSKAYTIDPASPQITINLTLSKLTADLI